MKIFLAGATGATGQLLAEILLDRGHEVVATVRSLDRLPAKIQKHPKLHVTEASLLNLSDEDLITLTDDCDAVVSCLGHNVSLKGLFGPPYRLVTAATQRLCRAVQSRKRSRENRFILMSSSGIRNPDQGERISFAEHVVILLLRFLVPPHADNEKAAAFLRNGKPLASGQIEWVAVRPDSLTDELEVTPYTLHASPTRSAIFKAGKTSRINVASFMADLIEQDDLWNQWKRKMPVIYNVE